MPNAILLMTALIPTLGHKYLIDFAKNLAGHRGKTHVILGVLPHEPVPGLDRLEALVRTYLYDENVTIHYLDRDVPQDPSEHPNFWYVWRDIVREFVDVQPDDYFVASELYGIDMANVLGCKFMPCNRYRETVPVKGTDVRNDLMDSFDLILPAFQKHLRKTVTIFGAESCGKTTMARTLAKELNGHFVPEWAREYLETVGIEVTDERMLAIVEGQAALQRTARDDLFDKPFVFQDTDLYSTLYYYKLWNGGTDHDVDLCEYLAKQLKSDMYILMNDQIPFEHDPLRYGGDKRESNTDFWENALKESDCKYYKVTSTDKNAQLTEVKDFLTGWFKEETAHVSGYVR
jgi:HTH-type transcriptional regulator, transcriptional repressor of NAD biosynthesis genes